MNSCGIIMTSDAEAESDLAECISVTMGVPEVALDYIQRFEYEAS